MVAGRTSNKTMHGEESTSSHFKAGRGHSVLVVECFDNAAAGGGAEGGAGGGAEVGGAGEAPPGQFVHSPTGHS